MGTTSQPCDHDQYHTFTIKTESMPRGVLRIFVKLRQDERAALCRYANKLIAGEPPCQCEKCRTTLPPLPKEQT